MPLPLSLLLAAMLFPLGAFLLLVAAGRRMGTTLCGAIGTLASLAAFTSALVSLMHWLNGGVWSGQPWGAGRGALALTVNWAPNLPFGLYADSLTLVMVTAGLLVSAAVHVFTTGYLRHDIRAPRIFALLAIADTAFIGLLTSPSLPQWAAWAIVGSIATYLVAIPVPLGPGGLGVTPIPRGLTSADLAERATAGLAMLLLRAAGDACLLLACVSLIAPSILPSPPAGTRSLAFADLWSAATVGNIPPLAPWLLIAAAIFHACVLPASLFLPDTKGSPTPATGLAYAVTMLPVGPLLLIRIFPVLTSAHLTFLTVIGGLTLVSSALFAVFESDLRRLLAWVAAATAGTTLLAVGTGSPGGAALHLVASMFALSILLLSAGSVLHACLGERRLWHYGGLLFRMPASALLLAHGAGTLLGGPFLAGSASWSAILGHAYRSAQAAEPRGYLALAALATGLLAIAVALGRCWALLLLGTPRDKTVYAAARESATLTVPVAILALVATVVGSAILSPVRQLVSLLPAEMSLEVSRISPAARPTDRAFPLWRVIPAPELAPPPLPDSDVTSTPQPPDEPPYEPPDESSYESPGESPAPSNERLPRAIDPIRWLLAAGGAITGLLLAGRGRGSFESRRRQESLAVGFHLSTVSVRLAWFLGQSVAALLLVVERLLIGPALDLFARIVLPFGRIPSTPHPAATATAQARPRAALLSMSLFSILLIAAIAIWGLSNLSPADIAPYLKPAGR